MKRNNGRKKEKKKKKMSVNKHRSADVSHNYIMTGLSSHKITLKPLFFSNYYRANCCITSDLKGDKGKLNSNKNISL